MVLELVARAYWTLRRLTEDERGQSLTEYGLILALIAIVVVGILAALGTELGNIFTRVKDCLASGAC